MNRLSCTEFLHSIEQSRSTGRLIVASLAPSYPAAFAVRNPLSVVSALRAVGFSIVEETALVMEEVARTRVEAIRNSDRRMLPLLSSSCSRVSDVIRRCFPELERRLVPRLSPMALHVRSLKERYGDDCTVAFIGPCTHKRTEAERLAAAEGSPDMVLTFDDLEDYFRETGVDPASLPPSEPDGAAPDWARAAVLLDGISGWDSVLEALARLGSPSPESGSETFLEVLACEGGCLSGDGMGSSLALPLDERRNRIVSYFKSASNRATSN